MSSMLSDSPILFQASRPDQICVKKESSDCPTCVVVAVVTLVVVVVIMTVVGTVVVRVCCVV